MSYTAKVKVRFGDIDHAGIAYYPNLYHYLHIAWEEFFEEFAGIPYPSVLDAERIGFPTVKVETGLQPLGQCWLNHGSNFRGLLLAPETIR